MLRFFGMPASLARTALLLAPLVLVIAGCDGSPPDDAPDGFAPALDGGGLDGGLSDASSPSDASSDAGSLVDAGPDHDAGLDHDAALPADGGGCPSGLTLCSDGCVDLRTDLDHCGACDAPCTIDLPDAYPVCAESTCRYECTGGLTACGSGCVDTTTSNAHCGGCGRPCPTGCVDGFCDIGVRIVPDEGAGQVAYPDQELAMPIYVRVHDADSAPVAGTRVRFTGPPGTVLRWDDLVTDSTGRAFTYVRLGRALGTYQFTVTSELAPTPAIIEATAVAPPPGTIFPILNDTGESGATATPSPATIARTGGLRGLAVAPDGTLYVTDDYTEVVRAITPEGVTTIVAGRRLMPGFSGDGGSATDAQLHDPSGLALDAAANVLYVADTRNHRVRAVDLTTGIITTYAGTGTEGTAEPYGDGEIATSAFLSSPGHVRIGPDGALYVGDVGHARIRRIDPVTRVITTYIPGDSASCSAVPVALHSCRSDQRSCDIGWDAAGRAFVTGELCGTDVISNPHGILRRDLDGTLVHVAGASSGSELDGALALEARFWGPGSIAIDPDGDIYFVEWQNNRIRRIDAATQIVTTIVGLRASGAGIAYAPAVEQPMNSPWDLVIDGTHIHASELSGQWVRTIWDALLVTP